MAPGGSPARLGCALLLVLVMLCSPLLAQIIPAGVRYEIPVHSYVTQNVIGISIDAYNRDSNSLNYYKVLRVLKAERQMVEGFNFFLLIKLVKTQCEKKGNPGLKYSDLERCAVSPEDEIELFHICAVVGTHFQVEAIYWDLLGNFLLIATFSAVLLYSSDAILILQSSFPEVDLSKEK